MFQFLKSSFARNKSVPMTQRQSVESLVSDLNGLIEKMDKKPVFTIDPNTGSLTLDLPDQMPDEALALPAPDAEEEKA